jgi:hypothetical protein
MPKWEILMRKQVSSSKESHLNDDSGRPKKQVCRREPIYIPAKGSQALPTISNDVGRRERKPNAINAPSVKCKKFHIKEDIHRKKRKVSTVTFSEHDISNADHNPYHPAGIKWDSLWWPCACDSLFVILHNIWKECDRADYEVFFIQNQFWNELTSGFQISESDGLSLETVRDQVRLKLHAVNKTHFPMGQVGAPIFSLCYHLLRIHPGAAHQYWQGPDCMVPYHIADECNLIQVLEKKPWKKVAEFNKLDDDSKKYSIQPCLNCAMAETVSQTCTTCRTPLQAYTKFTIPPKIYTLDMSPLK